MLGQILGSVLMCLWTQQLGWMDLRTGYFNVKENEKTSCLWSLKKYLLCSKIDICPSTYYHEGLLKGLLKMLRSIKYQERWKSTIDDKNTIV